MDVSGGMVVDEVLRDRWIAGLLECGGTLVTIGPVTEVRAPDGSQVLLAIGGDRAALAGQLVAAHKRGVLHVVFVGGEPDPGLERTVAKVTPVSQLLRRFGFHHAQTGDRLEHLSGQTSALLGKARKALPAEPPDAATLETWRVHGHEHANAERRLAQVLGARRPWVTWTLALVSIGLFVAGELFGGGQDWQTLQRMGGATPAILDGEVWRLFAATFLHVDALHLILNMVALFSFGRMLERLLGPSRYLLLYGLSGLGGSLLSLLGKYELSVGASGAIWGLMTAGVALSLRPRELLPPLTLAQARRGATAPLVANFLYSFAPNVNYLAHFGGGLVGFFLMFSGLITRGVTPAWGDGPATVREPAPLRLAALLVGGVMLASVVAGVTIGRFWELGEPPVMTRVALGDSGRSLELPTLLANEMTQELDDGMQHFVFGGSWSAPAVVEVFVGPVAEPATDAELEEARKAMEAPRPNGMVRTGPATIHKATDRTWLEVTFENEHGTVRSVVMQLAGTAIFLHLHARNEAPASWRGIDQRILDSLR